MPLVVLAAGLALTAAWPVAPARAQTADEFRRQVDSYLDRMRTRLGAEAKIRQREATTVAPDGNGLKATLSGVGIDLKDGGGLDLGTVEVTRRPATDRTHAIEVGIPPRITLQDDTGKPAGTLTTAKTQMRIVVETADQRLREAELTADGLQIVVPAAEVDVKVASVNGSSRLVDGPDQRASAPAGIELKGMEIRNTANKAAAKVGQLSAKYMLEGLRLADLDAFEALIDELFKLAEVASGGVDITKEAVGLLNKLSMPLTNLSYTIEASDLDIADDAGQPAVALPKLSTGLGLSGLDGDAAALRIGYVHEGLKIAGLGIDADYVPNAVTIDLGLEKLPLATLLTLGRGELEKIAVDPDAYDPDPMVINEAAGALFGAESALRIHGLKVDSPKLGGTLNGLFTLDASGPFMVSGAGELLLVGLEALMQERSRGTQSPEDAQINAYLALVMGFGKREQSGTGPVAHRYAIEVKAAGELLINGNDMTPLIMGLQGGGQPQQRR